MDMIKNIAEQIAEETAFVNTIAARANEAVQAISNARIGLSEDYKRGTSDTYIGKGDIVIDPNDRAAYVATGEEHNGKPIVANKTKRKALEKEFVTLGAHVHNPALRKAANRVSTEHPTRRVHVYGALPRKVTVGEATTNLSDQPLATKDQGIRKHECQPKKGDTSKGAEVNNDQEIFDTFMKKAGKTEKHQLGDSDAGNGKQEVSESLSDMTADGIEDKISEIKGRLKGMRDRKEITALERQKLALTKMLAHKKSGK